MCAAQLAWVARRLCIPLGTHSWVSCVDYYFLLIDPRSMLKSCIDQIDEYVECRRVRRSMAGLADATLEECAVSWTIMSIGGRNRIMSLL